MRQSTIRTSTRLVATLALLVAAGVWSGAAFAKPAVYSFNGRWVGTTSDSNGNTTGELSGVFTGKNKSFSAHTSYVAANNPGTTITTVLKGSVKAGDAILATGKTNLGGHISYTGQLDPATNTISGSFSGVNKDKTTFNGNFSMTKVVGA